MRIVYAIAAAVLALFAAVQYNDPDAWFWIPIYLVPALWACVAAWKPAAVRQGVPRIALLACVLLAAAGTAWFWPTDAGFWRQDVWWESEPAREGMGMMVVTVVLLLVALPLLRARR